MKIRIGMKFKNENDIFMFLKSMRTRKTKKNLKNVFLCKHEQLDGLWGFDEKDILENLIEEEKIEKAA